MPWLSVRECYTGWESDGNIWEDSDSRHSFFSWESVIWVKWAQLRKSFQIISINFFCFYISNTTLQNAHKKKNGNTAFDQLWISTAVSLKELLKSQLLDKLKANHLNKFKHESSFLFVLNHMFAEFFLQLYNSSKKCLTFLNVQLSSCVLTKTYYLGK